MPVEVILPKVDMDMASGTIAEWHKADGDAVTQGEALFEIETDKATMEVESPGTGVLHFVSAAPGDEVPIGHAVAWIFADGEEVVAPAGAEPASSGSESAKVESKDEVAAEAVPAVPSEPVAKGEGVRATPLARRIAKERGIDLASVSGTGPRGRITRTDVEAYEPAAPETVATTVPAIADSGAKTGAQKTADSLGLSYDLVPVNKMRGIIAARLTESKSTVPHFYLDADIQLDALLALRRQVNASGAETGQRKVSINDFLVKAAALALQAVPEANASWDGDQIVQYHGAHVSVAVAIDGGLVTPVVRDAQGKGLRQVSNEVGDLAARAKDGKLGSAELKGGSFSISNLGMFGVKSFNAIINPPEGMILAVGQGTKQFVPDEDGNPKLATIMSVTLSCDHRVVDGAVGAVWLSKFKSLVENPMEIVLN